MFVKYMHLERYGNEEVEGIEQGTTYVFPKLDGTNAQLWYEGKGVIGAGSRNRTLTVDNDNAGFKNWAVGQNVFVEFFQFYPDLTLYGEWLVPHSLKTYREDAWRKFYIFDIYNRKTEQFYSYESMKQILGNFSLDYLAPIAIVKNGTREHYEKCLDKNVFLIKDGMGVGEGIVIKNYEWQNKFGNTVWAKMITNNFKELNHKEMGAPVIGGETLEEKIVAEYVDAHLISKLKTDGGSSAYYDAPFQEFTTVNDMIDYYSKNFWGWRSYIFKDIVKAVTRFGRKEGTDEAYDAKKIIYYGCRLLMSVTDKATTREYLQQLLDDKQFKGKSND